MDCMCIALCENCVVYPRFQVKITIQLIKQLNIYIDLYKLYQDFVN